MIKTEELVIEVIDDSDADRLLFRSLLDQRIGKGQYFFLEASEAERGLEVFSKSKPDCVILDYRLPDEDGDFVLRKIKELDKNVPVIVVTSEGDESIATQMMCNGASYYLPKRSIDADTLFKVIFDSFSRMKKESIPRFTNSELLGLMTHEIKTPLNTITMVSEMLKEANLDEESKVYLDVLIESADMLVKVSDSILNLQKIESTNFQLNMVPGDLSKTVNRVVEFMNYSKENPAVKLIAEVEEGIPQSVLGDFLYIKQILINLINNSLKCTFKGHVKVKLGIIEKSSSRVLVKIDIEDTGIGIPPDKIDVIFDKYNQACPGIIREKGAGLGLAVCKALVDVMGGEIYVTSELGNGSTFSIELPFVIFNGFVSDENLN